MALSKSLIEGTTSLLTSEKYSDLTITTQTRSFKVHRAIVCTQSKVLAAMSDAGFKESSTAILALEHDHLEAIERMVTFLYTGYYHDRTMGIDSRLMLHALVYSVADKYDIQGLKQLAKVNFEDAADGGMCDDFPAIAATVFDTTPSSNDEDQGLRGVVSRICADHIDEILACDAWTDVLNNNGAVALAILKLARQDSVADVDRVKEKLEASEKELNRSNSCIERLHEKFDEAHEDLERIADKWKMRRGEGCEHCQDNSFHGLWFDLEDFGLRLPTREDIGSLSV